VTNSQSNLGGVKNNKILNRVANLVMQTITSTAAIFMVAALIILVLFGAPVSAKPLERSNVVNPISPYTAGESGGNMDAGLPNYSSMEQVRTIERITVPHTVQPERAGNKVAEYTVQTGDSIFSVANKYKIKPETILWANYDILNDSPDMMSLGLKILIPPVDGIYHQVKTNDTVNSIAATYKVKVEAILNWTANNLDMANPVLKPGSFVMVPGGKREFKQWVVPTIPRGKSGTTKSILGPGACDTAEGGANGTGSFVWPATQHHLSGNDYWSGHLGVDVAGLTGDPVFAADSGVIVYAGWITGGYGLMAMVDHGNGYQTLYAHLNDLAVHCGQVVRKGQVIGYVGNTGNSFGSHLHFEVRYQGGFINPWFVLP
jgi:murein DD-endopeptidase MepM/ murein hydrolase activator NlpD